MMNLEQYRGRIRRSIRLLGCLCIAFLLLSRLSSAMASSYAVSLLAGMAAGGSLLAIPLIIRYSRALKDDVLLRRLYNQAHDERKQTIRAKAGLPMGLYMSLGMIAAALIASPFSETVMFTLVAAAVAQLLVCCCVKLICMRRM